MSRVLTTKYIGIGSPPSPWLHVLLSLFLSSLQRNIKACASLGRVQLPKQVTAAAVESIQEESRVDGV